ncbi:CocE/NonD family hydrolase [Nocardia higoensis]|uniref:CocE/NonD family hydrolase n=1 Tax=Nocardia higoensis TaxID=228599 RepID=A0ABS0DG96_9NOCA|nr:CocE/NonD family hydrolase [Nocardia higoensis]MBF6357501.1 CocE/NonD family hydrolase [Nocardia higoensis]
MRKAFRITVAGVAAALILPFLGAGGATAGPLPAGPDGGAAGQAWAATHDGPQTYPNIHITWDVPITMSDGTVLKANLYRPADFLGLPAPIATPTVVNMTPYTKLVSNLADHASEVPGLSETMIGLAREIDMTGTPLAGLTDLTRALGGGALRNFSVDRSLVRSGYTQLVVDVRGTGFSQGEWDMLRDREQRDTVEVIDWASRQPWSNGRVGMSGISYSAINQVQAAEKAPPALQAIFPIVPGSDLINDVLAPGGGFGMNFIPLWLTAINSLKWIPDVQSLVTGNFDQQWLTDRMDSPLTYMDVFLNAYSQTRVEDLDPRVRSLLSADSPERTAWLGDPSRITIPTFVVGGWHDLFTYSQSQIYNQIAAEPGRKQLLMGNTYHLNSGAESGKPGLPPRLDVLQRAWFDRWLKDIDNGIDRYGPVTLREQGGGWITRAGFGDSAPAEEVAEHRRMYLSGTPSGTAHSVYDGSLLASGDGSTQRLTVAPGLTGLCSNDAGQATAGVLAAIDACGADARIHETNGLTFTSAPVAEETEISGPVAIRLNTVHDAVDGYWSVTINDVAPDGRSTVLSSGQLAASLSEIDESRSSRSANGDYTDPRPVASLESRKLLTPGEAVTLDIALPATHAVLKPGHRLRVDVFAGNFPKGLPILTMLADTGLKPQHLQLDPTRPSFVNIPVRGNPGW